MGAQGINGYTYDPGSGMWINQSTGQYTYELPQYGQTPSPGTYNVNVSQPAAPNYHTGGESFWLNNSFNGPALNAGFGQWGGERTPLNYSAAWTRNDSKMPSYMRTWAPAPVAAWQQSQTQLPWATLQSFQPKLNIFSQPAWLRNTPTFEQAKAKTAPKGTK